VEWNPNKLISPFEYSRARAYTVCRESFVWRPLLPKSFFIENLYAFFILGDNNYIY